MPGLRILVGGAGIAGNALAFWLSRLGHVVHVVERYPSLRVNGLQLDLRGHGIEVLKRMGLEEAFRAKAIDEQGMQLVDRRGRRRAYFPAKKSGKGSQAFTSEFEIMRGDLCQIIYDATKDRARYIFGTSIQNLEEESGLVNVRFTNGDTASYDMLIGADGQGSRTRKMMRGAESADAFQPLGEYVAYFTIPRPIQDGEEYIATTYIAPGGRFVMTRRHNPHRLQVYLTGKNVAEQLKSNPLHDVKQQKAAFAEAFRGAGWEVDAILESLMETDDFYCECQGIVKLQPWSRGRVVMVGDAAYCPSAETGMGTTSALVGAYILAGEIGEHCQNVEGKHSPDHAVTAALKKYEDRFRPFMDHVQKGVGDPSVFDKIQFTPFLIGAIQRIAGLVAFLRLDRLVGPMTKQDVKGWDLPEYKDMVA